MTTAPAPTPTPVPQFPAVFEGIGALVVDCSATDPAVLLEEKLPHVTWIAAKLTGADTGGEAAVWHSLAVWRTLGVKVGGWIYCDGPPKADVESLAVLLDAALPVDFIIFDVEAPYKADEGGHYEWAAQLVDEFQYAPYPLSAAVTSYGAYKATIDFTAFARAGWPIFAQVYDTFALGDEQTYRDMNGGVYPDAGIHALRRSLRLQAGQAVYRPESLDA